MDPGLQPERTAMAWTRTAAGLLANGTLLLHKAWLVPSQGRLPAAALVTAAGVLAYCYSRQRAKQLQAEPYCPPPRAVLLLLSLAVLSAAITGLIGMQRG